MRRKQPEEVTPGTVWIVLVSLVCVRFERYLAIRRQKGCFFSGRTLDTNSDKGEQDLVPVHCCVHPGIPAAGLS